MLVSIAIGFVLALIEVPTAIFLVFFAHFPGRMRSRNQDSYETDTEQNHSGIRPFLESISSMSTSRGTPMGTSMGTQDSGLERSNGHRRI